QIRQRPGPGGLFSFSVDPDNGDLQPFGRHDIVIITLGSVKQSLWGSATTCLPEVSVRGLVGMDLLGSHYRVKYHLQMAKRVPQEIVNDIRQDSELKGSREPQQRWIRVREGWPGTDARGQKPLVSLRDLESESRCNQGSRAVQHVAIRNVFAGFQLRLNLMVSLDQRSSLQLCSRDPGLKGVEYAAFPVNQSPVTIKSNDVKMFAH